MHKIKEILKTTKEISQKKYSNRKSRNNFLFILIHFIVIRIRFGYSLFEYNKYKLNIKDKFFIKYFISSKLRASVIKKSNKIETVEYYNNKYNYISDFSQFTKRSYINVNLNSNIEILEFFKNNHNFIAKPINSYGGQGIEFLKVSDYETVNKLVEYMKDKNICLAEELIIQDNKIAKLSPNGVAILRIVTFKNKKGIEILNIIIVLGNKSFVVNGNTDGIYCLVNHENGIIISNGIDKKGNYYEKHPISNEVILGYSIPYWNDILCFVKSAASELEGINLIGWDVALSKNGPVIIEGNFNKPAFAYLEKFYGENIPYLLKNS